MFSDTTQDLTCLLRTDSLLSVPLARSKVDDSLHAMRCRAEEHEMVVRYHCRCGVGRSVSASFIRMDELDVLQNVRHINIGRCDKEYED